MIDTIIYSVIDLIEVFLSDSFGSIIAYVCLLGTILALFLMFRRGTGW